MNCIDWVVTYHLENWAEDLLRANSEDGNVRLIEDKYPEVFWNGKWSPICGPYFWDNDFGASLFCQRLNSTYQSGIKNQFKKHIISSMALYSLSKHLLIGTVYPKYVDKSDLPPVGSPLEADALRIGRCLSGDTWLKCNGGKNDHIGPGGPKCVIGEPAAIEIYCT